MGKRTRLWRWAAVIIIGAFLLTAPACGKKADPIPPADKTSSQTKG
jgi:hypothetical protein